jgi:ketoreductase RED2
MPLLDGQVALITGSSSGIGAATARRLADEGAAIVVNSHSSVEAGERIAAALPRAIYVSGDVADEAHCRRLVVAAIEHFGRLDILVNNAGTTALIPHADLDAVTNEIFHRILDTNLLGTWYLTRAALPHLRQSPAGAVVNVTSVAGVRPTGSSIPYAVSKAAINHLTHLVWSQRRGRGIGARCMNGWRAKLRWRARRRRRTSPTRSSACSSAAT